MEYKLSDLFDGMEAIANELRSELESFEATVATETIH